MTFVLSNARQRETSEGFLAEADLHANGETRSLAFSRFGNHPAVGDWSPSLDPFLVALLMPAMIGGRNIIVEGDIDETLVQACRGPIQATIRLLNRQWQHIDIDAGRRAAGAVRPSGAMTGMSCGIDSLYTHACLRGESGSPAHLKPTVFVHNHVGAHPDEATFRRHRQNAEAYARAHEIPLVSVVADLGALYPGRFIHNHTLRNIAAALTIDHLFGAFVYSSSEEIGRQPKLGRASGISTLDPVLVPLFSRPEQMFVPFGFHATRIEKAAVVVDMPEARAHLVVCTHAASATARYLNCGQCYKCAQFLAYADANGKIEAFADVFDLGAFRANRSRILFRFLRHSIGDRRSVTDLRFLAYLDRANYPLPRWLKPFLPLVRRQARALPARALPRSATPPPGRS